MEKKILQDVGPIERKQLLRDSAHATEEFTYPRGLDSQELTHLKDEYHKNAIKMAKLEEQRKEFMENWKADVKPLKLEMGDQMTMMRSKVEEMTEDVYLMPEREEGMMGYYNVAGELVYSRPLMPEENQFSIVDATLPKNGTIN